MMRSMLLFLMLISCAILTTVNQVSAQTFQAVAVARDIGKYNGKIVTAIGFCGSERFNVSGLLAQLKTKVGQPLQPELIQQDFQALIDQHCFDDYRSDLLIKETDKGLEIKFKLLPCRKVHKIHYQGIITDEGIKIQQNYPKKKWAIKPGDQFKNSTTLAQIKESFHSLLTEVDDDDVMIESCVQWFDRDASSVDISVTVDENPDAYVDSVEFIGNKAFSQAALLARMKNYNESKLPDETEMHYLKRGDVNSDLNELITYLISQGYFKAKLVNVKNDDNGNDRKVIVTLDEGPQFKVGTISLLGTNIVNGEEVARFSALKQHKKARQNVANELIELANERLSAKGEKLNHEVLPIFHENNSGVKEGVVDLVVLFGNFRWLKFGQIEITGNNSTRAEIILRAADLEVDDYYNASQIFRALEALNDLNLFSEVKIEINKIDPITGRIDLSIAVKEKELINCQ